MRNLDRRARLFDKPFVVQLDAVNVYTGEIEVSAIGNEDTFRYIDEYQKDEPFMIEDFYPYLRPMSSMTKEEREEFLSIIKVVHWEKVGLEETGILSIDLCECYDNDGGMKNLYDVIDTDAIDWLNKKMFDYRGLILKGLAFKAPEGMYNG